MLNKLAKKKSFTLIEIIISLIVIAICVLPLPLVIDVSQRLKNFNSQQEAIIKISSLMQKMLSSRWDKNSLEYGVIKVLDTNSKAEEFKRIDENSTRRIGHIKYSQRRKMTNPNAIGASNPPLSPKNNPPQALEDYSTQGKLIKLFKSNLAKYNNFYIKIDVDYVDDMLDNSSYINTQNVHFSFDTDKLQYSTNIKMVTIRLYDKDNLIAILRAYSSNIGDYSLLRDTNW